MGFNVDNSQGGPHVSGGSLLGYAVHVHRGDQNFYSVSPSAAWSAFRAVLVAARTGTDAQFDAAALVAWGSWWADVVVARGQRAAMRLSLANYLPFNVPIP